MYAKAHPFGYKKVAAVRDDFKNFRNSVNKKNKQTVTIDCPYEVTERVAKRNPETGKLEFVPVMKSVKKNGKTVKVPKTKTFHNTISRHVTHYNQ
jgi:hypothetical protein